MGHLGILGRRLRVGCLAVVVVGSGVLSFVDHGADPVMHASFAEGSDGELLREGRYGTYAFMETQPGTKNPVTYGPCRKVLVQINSAGEVPGGSQLVLDAMARVKELSGIDLVYAGPSNERPDAWHARMQDGGLEAYPPVLVSWSDEDETPRLADDVVGLGGSIWFEGGGYARLRYMTGSIELDSPDLHEVYERDGGAALVQAVVMHELGHVVGLGHVHDSGELMSDDNDGQLDFGPGDREGLARLGSEQC